ncbi:MAG: HAMP domain-containing protein [Chloroflexi bacterium]|nr:HAMP domain-containing protein [Chloroflexota bacterium]
MFRDLRTQILLWTILPLVAILVGVAYLGVSSHQSAMRDLVAERDGALARVAAARVSEALANRLATLQALVPADPQIWHSQRTAFDGGIASFDTRGKIVNAEPSIHTWEMHHAMVAAMLATRATFSPPFAEGGATRVIVVIPTSTGALAAAFTLPPLANVDIGAHGVAYLVDAAGTIVAHPEASRLGENLAQHDGIAQVIRGESGAALHRDPSGAERVIGYAPVTPTGWGLIIEEPWEEVVAPMFQYSVLLPLVLLLAAIVALGAIYFGVWDVIRPLQNLAQAANRIAFGDYAAAERPVGGVREIDELRETLNQMAHQVQQAQAAMQNYIATIMRGQEDERMRLARELHDDTIQALIALQQRIEMAQKALTKDPALAATKMAELQELVADSLTAVRRFVRDLRPTYLENLGLIPALEMLTRESNASFQVVGEEKRLDAERELALFRITQEALRNVAKHARATQVAVTLAFDTDQVTATIEDNGRGFAAPHVPTAYAQAGHFGLMGMQERAQLFGGNVYVKSERGQGTKVVAYVPVSSIV